MTVMQFLSKDRVQTLVIWNREQTPRVNPPSKILLSAIEICFQANTALTDKESIVKAEAAEGDATMSGPRAMVEDEVGALDGNP